MPGFEAWLALAGLGALHGLNPAAGWAFAAARGVRSRDGTQAWRALLPLGAGHAVSVVAVAYALAEGASIETPWVLGAACVLALVAIAWHCIARRADAAVRRRAGDAGLALWSFLMATLHGAGMMLVPALVPLCLSENPAKEITASGSLALGLAAVAVHMLAMLLTTGLVAAGVAEGFGRVRSDTAIAPAPTRRSGAPANTRLELPESP